MIVFQCQRPNDNLVMVVMIDRGLVYKKYVSDYWFGDNIIRSEVDGNANVEERLRLDYELLEAWGLRPIQDVLIQVKAPPSW